MTNVYRAGRWRTWDEASQHVASGELRETHTVEFKSADYPKGKNGELAKDVAALAIDGGTLIVGIDEDKATGVARGLTPITLAGVVERYDQICAGRISPPLRFEMHDLLRDPADDTKGLLVIDIPATGIPHMVDSMYVGRDNRTTRVLAHEEVVRLLARRSADADAIEVALDRAYETTGKEEMPPGRLVFTAVPVPLLHRETLRDQLAGPGWQGWLRLLHEQAAERVSKRVAAEEVLRELTYGDWSWHGAVSGSSTLRIPRGVAVHFRNHEGALVHAIEVTEDAAVTVATMEPVAEHRTWADQQAIKVFDMAYALTVAANAVEMTAAVMENAGLLGSVGLGVQVKGIAGVRARSAATVFRAGNVYRDDSYRQTTIVTSVDLTGPIAATLDKLFGPLLRSMGYGDPLRPAPAQPD